MRILEVGYSFASGGAAVMASMLVEDLALMGHLSAFAGIHPPALAGSAWHALGQAPASDPGQARISRWMSLLRSPMKGMAVVCGHEDFHCPDSRRLLKLASDFDLVHLHNLHGSPAWFDLRMLPKLCGIKPVVVTMHDAWLTTGHCSHSFSCDRWQSGCGTCPDLRIHPPLRRDGTARNWQAKAALLASCRLHVAAPSSWMLDRARRSMLGPAAASWHHLPHGVDEVVFRPGDRTLARSVLGLPHNVSVLLFAAQGVSVNPFKDWDTLAAALRMVGDESSHPVIALAIGQEAPGWHHGNVEVRFVSWRTTHAAMAVFYHAADIYVHAARADTFPYTVLEALACGLPVVASAVGGIPEQLTGGGGGDLLGRLVPSGDSRAMSVAIRELLSDHQGRVRIGRMAAKVVAGKWTRRQTAEGYQRLFSLALAEHRE